MCLDPQKRQPVPACHELPIIHPEQWRSLNEGETGTRCMEGRHMIIHLLGFSKTIGCFNWLGVETGRLPSLRSGRTFDAGASRPCLELPLTGRTKISR